MRKKAYKDIFFIVCILLSVIIIFCECSSNDSKDNHLYSLRNLESRLASGENFNAEKGKGGIAKD